MRKNKYLILVITVAGLTFFPVPVSAGYNAIAFSRKSNIWGASYGLDTKKQARKEALKQCRSRGGRKCKVVMWSNRCSALAISVSGRGGYGTGSGTSHDLARKSAKKPAVKEIGFAELLSLHAKTNGTDLQISYPIEKRYSRTIKSLLY
ncbi:MAG: hypothetical protein CMN91_12340 [Synechococcus sp. ARS1019]|nr:hypothetical protein [Synechococcus sp. ARS1019]